MSSALELLPAVDVADGQAVQLVQGVAGSEKRFGDPVEAALRWQDAGAEWIHLVDLDAAFGRGHNRELLASIVGRVDVRVELSGGIRDDDSLAAAMATGCRRVNIGTAALEQPAWCAAAIAEWGDRVAVGLDVRGRTLAARGWTREGGDLYHVLARLDAFGGEAVVDIWVAPRRDTDRIRDLLKPWWEQLVEVRCEVPAVVAVERYVARPRSWPHLPPDDDTLARIRDAADHPESLGAPRTVVVDTARPVEIGDVVTAVRRETGARRAVRRQFRDGSHTR
jgi:1-(5-phosphoribosyl)-5-[(5-phosphoribosylamino)methylideneamino] imidazole-4-carboxamide isomerase/N-(5'phosphoribosyl)anthranilate isomerase